ncbi:MAG: hypothetical protein AB4368_20330 [Xenococcaceae cyanobacterium]
MKVTEVTAKMIKQFSNWLDRHRHFLFFWYTKDTKETQEPERSLIELPPELRKKLIDTVENLPDNPTEKQAILSAVNETFARWRENPNNTNNSLVILTSPVATVSRILSETLPEWAEDKQIKIKLLTLTARPNHIGNIKSQLENYLQPKAVANNVETEELEVLVIPNLGWCFLRSLEGLEGIEYLQTLLGDGSKNRFWIIGSGQVGWEYLNLIFNIEAYCGKVLSVPEIEPDKLQEWIEPIVEEFEIIFDDPSLEQKVLDRDRDNKSRYFDRLADISEGVSIVASQIFLKSICYEETKEDENKDEDEDKIIEFVPSESKKAIAKMPQLPDLPPMESADLYILYSLVLHGDLTISALAESLGDEPSEVQAKVQMLRRGGVIAQQENILKINPIHYPKLKQKLAKNNFVINR